MLSEPVRAVCDANAVPKIVRENAIQEANREEEVPIVNIIRHHPSLAPPILLSLLIGMDLSLGPRISEPENLLAGQSDVLRPCCARDLSTGPTFVCEGRVMLRQTNDKEPVCFPELHLPAGAEC